MPKKIIVCDESWPVYFLRDPYSFSNPQDIAEVPEDICKEFNAIEEQYEKMQLKLEEMYGIKPE